MAMCPQCELAPHTRAQRDDSTVNHRLCCIANNVQISLDQLLLVTAQLGNTGVVIATNLHIDGRFCRNQSSHVFQHSMNIELSTHQGLP